jgi:hypothetical protein
MIQQQQFHPTMHSNHGQDFANQQQYSLKQAPVISATNGDGHDGNDGTRQNPTETEMERIESNLQAVEHAMGYAQLRQISEQQQQDDDDDDDDVIELLDSDDDEQAPIPAPALATVSGVKRSYSQTYSTADTTEPSNRNAFPIRVGSTIPGYTGTIAQYQPYQYQRHQQQYMQNRTVYHQAPPAGQAAAMAQMYQQQQQQRRARPDVVGEPQYIEFPHDHTRTWREPLPLLEVPRHDPREPRNFEMSLLNVSEFTVTGLARGIFDTRRTSVLGYRKAIREISKTHGKAVFERDKENENTESGADGGKWRIPLGAYRTMVTFFKTLPNCYVKEIPEDQLKIASLGKARLEKGFPSVEKIVSLGVPRGLASALAPFQRGGVEFVNEKEGRALIADGEFCSPAFGVMLARCRFGAQCLCTCVVRHGFGQNHSSDCEYEHLPRRMAAFGLDSV